MIANCLASLLLSSRVERNIEYITVKYVPPQSKCMDPLHDNLFRVKTALICAPLIIAFVSHIPLGNNNNQYCFFTMTNLFLNNEVKRRVDERLFLNQFRLRVKANELSIKDCCNFEGKFFVSYTTCSSLSFSRFNLDPAANNRKQTTYTSLKFASREL